MRHAILREATGNLLTRLFCDDLDAMFCAANKNDCYWYRIFEVADSIARHLSIVHNEQFSVLFLEDKP